MKQKIPTTKATCSGSTRESHKDCTSTTCQWHPSAADCDGIDDSQTLYIAIYPLYPSQGSCLNYVFQFRDD